MTSNTARANHAARRSAAEAERQALRARFPELFDDGARMGFRGEPDNGEREPGGYPKGIPPVAARGAQRLVSRLEQGPHRAQALGEGPMNDDRPSWLDGKLEEEVRRQMAGIPPQQPAPGGAPGGMPPPPSGGPPFIVIKAGEIERVVDETEAALIAAQKAMADATHVDLRLFRRGNRIVSIGLSKEPTHDEKIIETQVIVPVEDFALIERMAATIVFMKYDGRAKSSFASIRQNGSPPPSGSEAIA